MAAEKTLMTAYDLIFMPDDGNRHELVRGELRTRPSAGAVQGSIASRLGIRFGNHVETHALGGLFGAATGFYLARNPDLVRAPDLAFVAAGRFPGGRLPVVFPELAPDLVAEVVSTQGIQDVEEKVKDWLDAGVRMVWVLLAATRTVRIHRPGVAARVITAEAMLDGEDVLPGFTCPVLDLFPE
jgi:Uma2 family endonuclease